MVVFFGGFWDRHENPVAGVCGGMASSRDLAKVGVGRKF